MKKSAKPLSKHTLHLNAGDYGKLRDLYPEIGAAEVIRRLVADFIRKQEDRLSPLRVDPAQGVLDV